MRLAHPATDRNPGHGVARHEIDQCKPLVLGHEAARAALELGCLDNSDNAHNLNYAPMAYKSMAQ